MRRKRVGERVILVGIRNSGDSATRLLRTLLLGRVGGGLLGDYELTEDELDRLGAARALLSPEDIEEVDRELYDEEEEIEEPIEIEVEKKAANDKVFKEFARVSAEIIDKLDEIQKSLNKIAAKLRIKD